VRARVLAHLPSLELSDVSRTLTQNSLLLDPEVKGAIRGVSGRDGRS